MSATLSLRLAGLALAAIVGASPVSAALAAPLPANLPAIAGSGDILEAGYRYRGHYAYGEPRYAAQYYYAPRYYRQPLYAPFYGPGPAFYPRQHFGFRGFRSGKRSEGTRNH